MAVPTSVRICLHHQLIAKQCRIFRDVLPCLGFINGICCPHYDEEPKRKPAVKKFLDEKKLTAVISIEGGSALHMKNGKIFKSLSFYKNKSQMKKLLIELNL